MEALAGVLHSLPAKMQGAKPQACRCCPVVWMAGGSGGRRKLLLRVLLTGNLLSPNARVVCQRLVAPAKPQAVYGKHPAGTTYHSDVPCQCDLFFCSACKQMKHPTAQSLYAALLLYSWSVHAITSRMIGLCIPPNNHDGSAAEMQSCWPHRQCFASCGML